MHLALVGTPNSGKTALFNALTGSRQKVANYPGVTVERKEGSFVTPSGRQVSVVDLPGTYSLRGRSPDEEITRDVVLGRTKGEAMPDLVLCVADSTNLRLTIRLVLELKSTGRPLALVLNMFDIATRRGVTVDVPRLSEALGVPVVTSIAVRKGGTADLLRLTDEIAGASATPHRQNLWEPLTVSQLRATQREADRIIAATVSLPARPDTWTARIDAVVLHPVAGLAILMLLLFVMFQAVFAWAQPLMELLSSAFEALGQFVHDTLPAGLLQSFLQNGVISGVGSVIVFLPQIIIIFLFILLLEDFGYMARAAFLMDRIMGGAGLHGRAFIPLLSSFACAIPGIMATRVIDNRRDRLTTILIAPLMTCSARIPVYTLIISAFIPAKMIWGWVNLQGLVMFGLYAAGIVSALGDVVPDQILHVARLRAGAVHAGTARLQDAAAEEHRDRHLHAREYVPAARRHHDLLDDGADLVSGVVPGSRLPAPTEPAINYSLAAMIGKAIAPLLSPLGFNWQIAVALIPGMAAREVAVAALGTVYAIEGGKEAADANRTGAGDQMEPCHRAVAARLVHLRAAMRFHAGGDPPRNRQLEVDGGHLRLHAGARLCREFCHLQHRGGARRRVAKGRHGTVMGIENFRQLAGYNHWANRRLYDAALKMPDEHYRRPTGVFFGSLHGTLNHLLLTDRVWLKRLTGEGEHPARLNAILHEDLKDLVRARMTEDARLIKVIGGYSAADLGNTVSYQTMSGAPQQQPLRDILLHLFNHQTHHRGHAHACCSIVTGTEPLSLDLLLFQRGVPAPDLN